METRSLLSVFFPALLLFAGALVPPSGAFEKHREVFGGPHYYLTIAYLAAPTGPLSTMSSRFKGVLVHEKGEQEVVGTLSRQGETLLYTIEGDGKRFEATRQEKGPCPKALKLVPLFDSPDFPEETLQFGTCS